MKQELYCIYDTVAEVFNKPFTAFNRAAAEREFITAINEHPHKNDFTLYYIGDFNDASGQIDKATPKRILSAMEIKDTEEVAPDSLKVQAV